VVTGGINPVNGGAGGDGLASAGLAGDHGDAAGVDAEGDAGDGLGVVVVAMQHAGSKVAAEWHARESEE
jgi:hypothetical protein